ncbi:hypothetical protein K490DRAFT_41621 [Saccharata proteae CBS 121410]|uniref:Uncharacterized protein n=1 Tax=Saccharata proteae CBS 121410 TaxID=1314787 RepID=A0A9P4LZ39_9PEZI|nr:hypothetical protein K490DRAFT_41621 [Saccharata proteae CBS 121410]
MPFQLPVYRKALPFLALLTVVPFFVFYYCTTIKEAWRGLPQKVGMGEAVPDPSHTAIAGTRPQTSSNGDGDDAGEEQGEAQLHRPTPSSSWSSIPHFTPGASMPGDYAFNMTLVVPRTSSEDTDWMHEYLPDFHKAIYTADDPTAPLHPPKNKGHEVMIYLTWIIENYHTLPDVAVFMHAHRYAWHNNELLDYDAVQMLLRLSPHRVTRTGYMPLRCHWDPGCPDWMHPGEVIDDVNKQEQKLLAKAWSELFPLDPIPETLAQPCCSQFALSRERIRAIPLHRFTAYRDWLLRTTLSDYFSGRIWEYLWQWVFTGEAVHCPAAHVCYCDGFGLCFGGAKPFEEWIDRREKLRDLEAELEDWQEKEKKIGEMMEEGKLDEAAVLEVPEVGRDVWLREQIDESKTVLLQTREDAITRGEDPRLRALEVGRQWVEGDGF